jgi:hypothetical protein
MRRVEKWTPTGLITSPPAVQAINSAKSRGNESMNKNGNADEEQENSTSSNGSRNVGVVQIQQNINSVQKEEIITGFVTDDTPLGDEVFG